MCRLCALPCVALAAAAAAQPIHFSLAPQHDAGVRSQRAVLADLNGDGRLDAITASNSALSVSFGLGDGGFAAPMLVASSALGEIAAADVDNDGDADILAASLSEGRLLIFRNPGDGSLGAPEGFSAITGALDLAVADFTGDGWIDAVVSGFGTAQLLRNDGAGGFQPPTPTSIRTHGATLAAADVSGDGRVDLVAAGSAGIEVSFSSGGGSFGSPFRFTPGSGEMTGAAVADFDGDGRLDVAATSTTLPGEEDGLWIVRYLGNWQFAPPVGYALADSRRLTSLDLDGDADEDLAAVDEFANTVAVKLNDGAAGFHAERRDWGVGSRPTDLTRGDLDGDGSLDLLAPSGADGATDFAVLLGTGNGEFRAREDFHLLHEPRGLAMADFDRDGTLDAAQAIWITEGSRLSVLRGLGDGRFGPAEYSSVFFADDPDREGGAPQDTIASDFNGDGWSDVAVSLFSPVNALLLAINDGAGDLVLREGPGEPLETSGIPGDTAAADLDGDGDLDLAAVIGGVLDPGVSVFFNDGAGGWSAEQFYVVGEHPRALAFGDLDGDGDPDGALANDLGTELVLLWNEGGAFTPQAIEVGGPQDDVAIADFDGDGRVDIALARDSAVVLYNDGAGAFAGPIDHGGSVDQIGAGDVNRDGRPDLVGAERFGGRLWVIPNRGSRQFAPARSFQAAYGATWIGVGPLDGNATPDVVVANREGRSVSAFLQRCPADFNRDDGIDTLDVLAFLNAWNAHDPSGDFNGDGAINTLDVLGFLNAWSAGC